MRQTLRLFRTSLQILQAEVIRRAKVLFCTHQLAGSSLIRENFACRDTKSVVIIADEDGQALEPVSWIPIILPRCAPEIKAVLRFGDRFQLHPLALSATTQWNEFGAQINRSLLDRHLQNHPPAVSLNTQYRMHPGLSSFPNWFTYNGRLQNGALCASIQVEPIIDTRLKQWAKAYVHPIYAIDKDDKFSRLFGINVANKSCKTERNKMTSSRFNHGHVRAVLFALFSEKPYPKSEITIITPYSAQRALYNEVLRDLHMATNLPFAELPHVETVDSMQGHVSDVVIVDWVVGYYDRLGFLKDDRRVNVALTRCRSSLIVVSHQSGNDDFEFNPGKISDRMLGQKWPELSEHWNELIRKNLVIDFTENDDLGTSL